MGEYQRQSPVARQAQRGDAQQEGMLRVHDVGPEGIDRFAELRMYRQRDREIAGVEILDRVMRTTSTSSCGISGNSGATISTRCPRLRYSAVNASTERATPPTCGVKVLVRMRMFMRHASLLTRTTWSVPAVTFTGSKPGRRISIGGALRCQSPCHSMRGAVPACGVMLRDSAPKAVGAGPKRIGVSCSSQRAGMPAHRIEALAFLAHEAVADHQHPLGGGPDVMAVAHAAAAGARMDRLRPLPGRRSRGPATASISSRWRGSPARSSTWATCRVR